MAKKKKGVDSPVERPPAEGESAAAPEGRLLAWNQLVLSPQNPRKTIDPEAIAELAESIAAQGILQNLIARPHPSAADIFEIVAGERRYRAVGELVKAGRWDGNAPLLPAVVRRMSDSEALAIALIENLHRQDVPPMEEAEGFAELRRLDPARWTTATIADSVKRTQRYVQQRLALVEKLDDKVKDALRTGEIQVTHARALTVAKPRDQVEALEKIKAGYGAYVDAERLSVHMLEKLPLVAAAPFPLERYTGEIVDGPIPYGRRDGRRFLDVAQFETLRKEMVDEKKARLEKQWAWVEVKKGDSGRAEPQYGIYRKSSDKAKAGAVIFLDASGAVIVKTGLVKVERQADGHAAQRRTWEERQREEEREQKERTAAAKVFNAALRERLAARPGLALGLLAAEFATERYGTGIVGELRAPSERTAPWRAAFGELALRPNRLQQAPGLALVDAPDPERLIETLERLEDVTGLIASQAVDRVGASEFARLDLIEAALARHLGVTIPEILAPKEPYEAPRRCRMCGCTDENGCHDEESGESCSWAGPDLCSACVPPAEEMRCRHCGALALKKHKKSCPLTAEGKVTAASCGPDLGNEPAPGAVSSEGASTPIEAEAAAGVEETDLARHDQAADPLELPPSLDRRRRSAQHA
jgi:ParB/RepB/Spo0J family partition protein